MKTKRESYEWAKIPTDLPRENLVLVTAKTTKTTIHPEDPEYPVRIFKPEQLRERASSLAQRPVGLNHLALINGAFTVDAQWNEKEQAIEALLYLPPLYIRKIKEGEIKKVSVEYTWRDEKRTEEGVEFEGFVFNRIDLLSNINPGDSNTQLKLLEGKRGLMEGIIEMPKEESIENKEGDIKFIEINTFAIPKELEESADAYLTTLGEPFAGFKDFAACVRWAKAHGKHNPEAYCGYIKHKVEDPKKKEALIESATPAQDTKPAKEVLKEPCKEDKKLDTTPPTQDTIPPEHPKSVPVKTIPPPTVPVSKTGAPTPAPETSIVATPTTPPTTPPATPVAPTVAVDLDSIPPTPAKITTDIPPSDAKDVRITELEAAVTKLQENITKFEADKKKAIKDAEKKTRKELLEKIESTLPPGQVISNFNRGGQKLAEDIRRVIYKTKKGE